MKIILKKYFYFLLFIFFIQNNNATAGTIMYEHANQLYHNQQYTEALDLYMQMINEGVVNASVYYNAGNTNFKLNKIGYAIWCYQKALQYEPNNNIIKENLLLANSKIKLANKENSNNFILNTIHSILFFHTLNKLAIIAFLFFCSSILILVIKKFKNLPPIFIAIKKLSWLLFFIYFFTMIGQYLYTKYYNYGIIIQNTILYNSPKEKGLNNVENTEGMQVQVLQLVKGSFLNGNKYKIKMPNSTIVWVDESSLKML